MQHTEARTILMSLIEGRNPDSGERLPAECVVHRPDVIRALLPGMGAIDATKARAKRRAQLPKNVGRDWTTKEEEQLRSEFAAKEPVPAIPARTDAACNRSALADDGLGYGGAAHDSWGLHVSGVTPSFRIARACPSTQPVPARCNWMFLIFCAASFCATASASAAGTFTLGTTPMPSQSVLVIGLTKRA